MPKRRFPAPALLLLTLMGPTTLAAAQPGPAFAYGSATFTRFGTESYQLLHQTGTFDQWLADAYTRSGVPLGNASSLSAALDARRKAVLAASGLQRLQLERDTASWAHRFIKKAVPKFSLERGFELANVAGTGERQCLAQSVIIAALLQRAGLQAGAAMVWANPQGQQSNLGHVVTVVRLSSGHDLLVDASDPTPFVQHQGLLLRDAAGIYRFVKPHYASDNSITGYQQADGSGALTPAQTSPLSLSYLRSQFDYYRGERAPGGVLSKSTPEGLQQSVNFLRRSLQDDPHNALASYMLGHAYQKLGQPEQARRQYLQASKLYQQEGHVPAGMQEALKWVNGG
ncbi:tetratricopeptide repeat protein [Deinococcus sonorensis]|uniref:Tetratricopeptide repeat protein n=2 Tax=Deinococcus sonorensis TaxID=309891 RepID=A0AAU7UB19_9DEIO